VLGSGKVAGGSEWRREGPVAQRNVKGGREMHILKSTWHKWIKMTIFTEITRAPAVDIGSRVQKLLIGKILRNLTLEILFLFSLMGDSVDQEKS